MKIRIVGSILCLLLGFYRLAHATVLEDLARQMTPGTWAELTTVGLVRPNGYNVFESSNGPGSYILQYTDEAKWDAARKKVFFIGKHHVAADPNAPFGAIQYRDATNDWGTCYGTACPGIMGLGHSYDHLAIDSNRGRMMIRDYGKREIWQYNLDTGAMSLWTTAPSNVWGGVQVAAGVEYFPPMDSLLVLDGDFGLFKYHIATNTWSALSGKLAGTFSYHNFMEYSEVANVMIMGGGNAARAVWRMTAGGALTRMKDAPVDLSITSCPSCSGSVITTDPVSGKFLVFSGQGGMKFYQYDALTDVWTLQPSNRIPPWLNTNSLDGPTFGTVAAPINTYGVTMFWDYHFQSKAKVWLYKHSPGNGTPPDTVAPSTPSNLVVE